MSSIGRNHCWKRSITSVTTARISIRKHASGCRAVNSLQSVVLALSLSYAVVGALLLVMLMYARVRWSARFGRGRPAQITPSVSSACADCWDGPASISCLPPLNCCSRASWSRIRSKEIQGRSIYGSRHSTTPIGRVASPGPTAFHTATRLPKKPTRLPVKSPPATRRAVAPPILATAKAPLSKP